MKKYLIWIMCLVLAVSMVILGTGCKEPETVIETVTETVTETVVETVEVEKEKAEGVVTKIVYYASDLTGQVEYNAFYMNRMAAFMELYPDVSITMPQEASTIYYDKVALLISGNQLDHMTMYWGPGTYGHPTQIALETGAVRDWMPFLDADPEWKSCFLEKALAEQTNPSGQIACLPCTSTAQIFGYFVNTKLLDQYGFEVPTTWEELMDCCAVLKDNGIVPIAYCGKDQWAHWVFETMFRAFDTGPYAWDTLQKIGTGEEKFNNPDYLKAVNYLKSLYDNGYIPENIAQVSFGEAEEMFKTGKSAFIGAGTWVAADYTEALGADNITFIGLPLPADANYEGPMSEVTYSEGIMMGSICEPGSKEEEAVVNFAKFLTTKESAQMMITDVQRPPAVDYDDLDYSTLQPLIVEMLASIDDAVPMQFGGQFTPNAAAVDAVFKEQLVNLFSGLCTAEEFLDAMDAAQERALEEAGL